LSCGFTSGLGGFYALTHCAAKLINAHGTPAQRDAYVKPLIEGTFGGTMALSEAQSGSSLSELSCRARHVSGDEYRLSGNKMWTSGFDHDCFENIVHLVLAKIDGVDTPKGNRGISLFIVPKLLPDGSANDIALNGLNHKMGQRALPNSYWSLGDKNDGCVGYLVGGVQHAGLMQMFTMMCAAASEGSSRRRRRGCRVDAVESISRAGTTCAWPWACTRPAVGSGGSRRV
jgi:alkylation response protein AidB-like acyl-CoA dehydrogenase